MASRGIGGTDPNEVLENLTPDQFGEWAAFLAMQKEEQHRMLACVLAMVHNAGILAGSAFSGRPDPKAFRSPKDFMEKSTSSRGRIALSAAESELRARMLYGGK